ncbi:MAG: hypothetical protein MZV70_13390 [Desulfobacterales bacterium]|nr:hypothetical protein [Desulfobacterales bacterium]
MHGDLEHRADREHKCAVQRVHRGLLHCRKSRRTRTSVSSAPRGTEKVPRHAVERAQPDRPAASGDAGSPAFRSPPSA